MKNQSLYKNDVRIMSPLMAILLYYLKCCRLLFCWWNSLWLISPL